MVEITDSVKFADKFEEYLKENCVGSINYYQRVIISRALMDMVDEMDV